MFLGVVLAMIFPAVLMSVAIIGCQSGTTGLLRPMDPTVEKSVTNTVFVATQTAAAVAPAPFSTAIEAGGAAVLGLLAAWQAFTHGKMKIIEANTTPPPPSKLI